MEDEEGVLTTRVKREISWSKEKQEKKRYQEQEYALYGEVQECMLSICGYREVC